MKSKSLVTLILTVCLAVITSNAMAKSDKSGKSKKSKKSKKSGKRGKGLGHCKSDKSDKSGKRHKKKRGKGHDRDCDGDDGEGEEIIPVCLALESDVTQTPALLGVATITFEGPVCAIGDEIAYQDDIVITSTIGTTTCSLDSSTISEQIVNSAGTEFQYDMKVVLACTTQSNF